MEKIKIKCLSCGHIFATTQIYQDILGKFVECCRCHATSNID